MVCSEFIQISLVRRVWQVIEQTQSLHWLQWSDQELVHQLLRQIQDQYRLNGQEEKEVQCYLCDRITLIRDVVSQRGG